MIDWHWLYRDFIAIFEHGNSSDKWLNNYEKLYLNPNYHIFEEIHFKQKGFYSREDVLKRINELGYGYFDRLSKSIGNIEEFERLVTGNTNEILKAFDCENNDGTVYVIVGLGCTNIYSTVFEGKPITVICIESLDGVIEKINLLLSHEVHHWVREKVLKYNLFGKCNGERAVTEGLAICCSEYLFPGYTASEYCYVPESTVNWVIEHWNVVDRLLSEQANSCDLTSGFFSRNKTSDLIRNMPFRIGYVYGYLKVRNYIENYGGTPISLVGELWEEVIEH